MGITGSLLVGVSALESFGQGLQVVSNNVANADTPGYTRRRAVIAEATPPEAVRGGFIGRGATFEGVQSFRDKVLNKSYHLRTSTMNDYDARLKLLTQIESLFSTNEDFGLAASLESFWDAWDDLANRPEGEAERTAVIYKSQNLAGQVGEIYGRMKALRTDQDTQIDSLVGQVNNLTESIADLNDRIKVTETGGVAAVDLRDQRDEITRQLAELVGIDYFEDDQGGLTISLSNGKTLVSGRETFTLSSDVGQDGNVRILWSADGSDIAGQITGGKLGGWLEVRNVIIPQYMDNLDEFANGVIREVNRLHATGVGQSALTQVTGTYAVADADAALASEASGLPFWEDIQDDQGGYFKIFVYDTTGAATSHRIEIGATTTLNDLIGAVKNITLSDNTTPLSASQNADGGLVITARSGYSFAFGEVNSDALMALGINTFFDGDGAGLIQVNSQILSNHDNIAAGLVETKTGEINPGDNSVALEIADLRQTRVDLTMDTYQRGQAPSSSEVNLSLGEFLGSLIGALGVTTSNCQGNLDFNTMLVNQLESMIAESAGVNLDEEMVELLKYQRAYQAAARIITTADEMLQTLIQM